MSRYPLLEQITGPQQIKSKSPEELVDLAHEIRQAIHDQVSQSGGHLLRTSVSSS